MILIKVWIYLKSKYLLENVFLNDKATTSLQEHESLNKQVPIPLDLSRDVFAYFKIKLGQNQIKMR